MSVAGLAGLVSAFRRGDQWDRIELWRLRNIARLSFLVVFLALIVYPIYSFVGDEVATIRLASGTIAAALSDNEAEVVAALHLRLSADDLSRLTHRYTSNPHAYDLYLRGRPQGAELHHLHAARRRLELGGHFLDRVPA